MSGTRWFFIVCLLASVALIVAVTTATLQARTMPAEAVTGMNLWQQKNCQGCHTIYGQGGAYAPDLTHIYSQRGAGYLQEFLLNPGAFHPNQRAMPAFGLTVNETTNLLAFLEWVGDQDIAVRWPPQPILVSGGGSVDTTVEASAANLPNDPAARGRLLFKSPPAICSTCHALQPGVVIVGPSLDGIATRAETRVAGMNAEAYIRDSIIHPSNFIAPGFQDVMQKNFGDVLTSDQINDLIAFLMTLK